MDAFQALAGLLVDARTAWIPEPAVADLLHLAEPDATLAVNGLVAGGLIARWTSPAGPVVTLTPLGAAQLDLHLVEVGSSEVYRWSSEAVSVRSTRVSARQIADMERRAEWLEHRPELSTWHDTDAGARVRHNGRPMLRPPDELEPKRPEVLLLGGALDEWHESSVSTPEPHCVECAPRPRQRKDARAALSRACRRCGFGLRRRPRPAHCPACRGAELPRTYYCLRCDRWGLEGFLRRRGYFKNLGFGPPTKRPRPLSRKVA